MDTVFKALSDPTRREILRLLGRGEMTAGTLAEKFEVSAPTMSHHFATLKEADLITSRREGTTIHYALNTTVMQDVLTWAMGLVQRAEGSSDGARASRKEKAKKGSR